MRVGVHLCAGCLGRSWLLRLSSRRAEVLLRAALCCAEGLRALLPFSSLQRAVCWPPCVPGSEWQAALCVRQACSRVCKVLVAAEAGSVRKDGGTALVPAAGLTRRLPVCCQHTDGHCSEGLSAQKHRSASLVKEKPASREAPLQCISRHPRSAALVEMLCPYEKELQLADGRTAHVIAAALDSPALHAVFEEPKKKRARSRVGEHQGQVAADLRGMHAPVRGIDSSHCPRPGAASDAGEYYNAGVPERPGLRSRSAARGHSTAHWRRLLPKSRLASADEPPAEEADEAPDDNNDGDGDPRDGARAEVGPAIASSAIPHEVAEDHRVRRTGKSSRAPAHICAGSTSSTAARRCTRARRSALECLLRRYVCISICTYHMESRAAVAGDRSVGRVARRHSAPRRGVS